MIDTSVHANFDSPCGTPSTVGFLMVQAFVYAHPAEGEPLFVYIHLFKS